MFKIKDYQDFMLTSLKPSFVRRIGRLLFSFLTRRNPGRFYPTRFKRLNNGNVEVTFNLPPEVLSQMRRAITNGKTIRLYVP